MALIRTNLFHKLQLALTLYYFFEFCHILYFRPNISPKSSLEDLKSEKAVLICLNFEKKCIGSGCKAKSDVSYCL